ncbi:MAG: hypothetical protein U0441_07510 [Polyangiaceae bacterium]
MRRANIFFAMALALGCSEPAPMRGASPTPNGTGNPGVTPPSPATSTSTTKGTMISSPLDLVLRVEGGNRLVAVLHNHGGAAVSVVADSRLQPVQLELTGPSGRVEGFDTRMVQKFDATVYENSFTTIAPGQDAEVQFANVQGGGLQWGPFKYESLPAGTYKAQAVLDSRIEEYQDAQKKPAKKADAWTGTVRSNEVTFQVK